MPPAARPWECGAPTPVTPRPYWGPGVAETWGQGRWGRGRVLGVAEAKGGGGRGVVCRAGSAWSPGSCGPSPVSARSSRAAHPSPGSDLRCPLLLWAAPAPLGPSSPLGKPPDFGGQPGNYAWRAGCGCGSGCGPGAERRAAAGGREAGEATCQRVCVVAGLGSLHLALPSARGLGRAGLQRASPREFPAGK